MMTLFEYNVEEDKITDSESDNDSEQEHIETDTEEVVESESEDEDEMVSIAAMQCKVCKNKWAQPPQPRYILEK